MTRRYRLSGAFMPGEKKRNRLLKLSRFRFQNRHCYCFSDFEMDWLLLVYPSPFFLRSGFQVYRFQFTVPKIPGVG